MKNRIVTGATLAAFALLAGSLSADDLKSGLETGSKKISAFHPLHANGPAEGKRVCLV